MNHKKLLRSEELFLNSKSRVMCDWSRLFEHLFVEGSISKEDAKKIITTASKYFGIVISK